MSPVGMPSDFDQGKIAPMRDAGKVDQPPARCA